MKATEIIDTAARLVGGERSQQHGDKRANMQGIADMWNAYLARQLSHPIAAEQVPWMMVLLKIARTKVGGKNLDNAIDAAGYAGIAGELMGAELAEIIVPNCPCVEDE
jgi:hypothetical protein